MQIPAWFTRTNLYYAALIVMIMALPLSKYVMSMAQFGLLTVWVLNKNILEKWKAFFRNRAAMILVSIYLLHVIGLLWTTDFDYALKDLRIKLPLLALPIIISTSPKVSRSLFHYMILIFIAANVLGTIASMHELLTKEIVDIREISLFMSHIRFSLNICVAIFSGFYLIFISDFFNIKIKILLLITLLWLLVFLVILESVTGLAIIAILSIFLGILTVFRLPSPAIKISLIAVLFILPTLFFVYVKGLYDEQIPDKPFIYEGMDERTPDGNVYQHYNTAMTPENGYWLGQYINYGELEEVWAKRSQINIDSSDARGNAIRFTLLRYLTSVGLRKDGASLRSLSDEEIRHIENGIANVRQLSESNLENRLRTIIWEIIVYKTRGDISGHSVMQRLEFWKAGRRIIANNFWIGTGTGDIKQAYQKEYIEMNTKLEHQFRWRAHNQYLSVFATFGIFGLLWFLFALIYPAYRLKMFSDYFYLIFFVILILSMLSEDTIENQAGATFFAFFTAFFLFAREQKMTLFTKKTIDR